MWTVFVRNPGIDEDFCWENDCDYFKTKKEAEKMAAELEINYKDDGWLGHKYYRSQFYAWEVSESYLENKQHQWALWMSDVAV